MNNELINEVINIININEEYDLIELINKKREFNDLVESLKRKEYDSKISHAKNTIDCKLDKLGFILLHEDDDFYVIIEKEKYDYIEDVFPSMRMVILKKNCLFWHYNEDILYEELLNSDWYKSISIKYNLENKLTNKEETKRRKI